MKLTLLLLGLGIFGGLALWGIAQWRHQQTEIENGHGRLWALRQYVEQEQQRRREAMVVKD